MYIYIHIYYKLTPTMMFASVFQKIKIIKEDLVLMLAPLSAFNWALPQVA